jgi:hypothetical protein
MIRERNTLSVITRSPKEGNIQKSISGFNEAGTPARAHCLIPRFPIRAA